MSTGIREWLVAIEEEFPIANARNSDSKFAGNHHIILDNDVVMLGIWKPQNEKIMCWLIALDREEEEMDPTEVLRSIKWE